MLLLSSVAAALAAASPGGYTVDWSHPQTVEIQDQQTYVELVASAGEFPDGVVFVVQFFPLRPVVDWPSGWVGERYDISRAVIRVERPADSPARSARAAAVNGELVVSAQLPTATHFEIITWFDANDPSNTPFRRQIPRHDFRTRRFRETFAVARGVDWLDRATAGGADLRSDIASFLAFIDDLSSYLAENPEPAEQDYEAWLERYHTLTTEVRDRAGRMVTAAAGDALVQMLDSFQTYVSQRGRVATSLEQEFDWALRYRMTGEWMTVDRARELAGQFDQIAAREAAHMAASVLTGIADGAVTVLAQTTGVPLAERASRLQELRGDLNRVADFLSPESLGASWVPVFDERARIEEPEPMSIAQMTAGLAAWLDDATLAVGGDADAQTRAQVESGLWADRLQRLRNRILTGQEVVPEAPLEGEPVEEDPEETDNP